MATKNSAKYIKFIIYLVVIVMVNLAGSTLFFRVDMTKSGIYSLSSASKEVVSTLSEPLTIKVFFTKNLPAPHNATEQYLKDLLEEYAVHGNRYFNYTFHDVSPLDEGTKAGADDARELAESYGIMPVQIQAIQRDEVKFKQAYMGLALIHGDMVEKIPTITSTDQLEYQLTTAIMKLNNKISALMSLKEKVKITLFMSSSLKKVAKLMGTEGLTTLPSDMDGIINKVSSRTYGKIDYNFVDPSAGKELDDAAAKYSLKVIDWPEIPQRGIAAGKGTIGLVMEYGGKVSRLPILNVMRIPIIGTTYELQDPVGIEESINGTIETLIGINRDLGYLSGHGTLSTASFSPMGGQNPDAIGGFARMVAGNYSLKEVNLKDENIPPSLNTLVIARPTEPFSDYELFQIDQALMRGTNLAVFTDAFKEEMPQRNQFMGFNQGPLYKPMDTGLEKLLEHYGVRIKRSYLLDENCYKQRDQRNGGEMPVYFAPIIKNKNINSDVDFMKNIKGLIALQISPLELDEEKIRKNDIRAVKLFSSSEKSWEMRDRINLNPMFIKPPVDEGDKMSMPLAYLLEGEFPSYFKGKPVPEKEVEEKKQGAEEGAEEEEDLEEGATPEKTEVELTGIKSRGNLIEKGKKSSIFLVASSNMLRDNLIGQEGETINGTFLMNAIDALNGRGDIAAMRSKKQSFNPLFDTGSGVKSFVKSFNIAGLPLLVAVCGLGVWLRRSARKKQIRNMFMK